MSTTEAGQILDSQAPPPTPTAPEAPSGARPAAPKDEPIASKLSVLMARERQAVNSEKMAKAQEARLSGKLKEIEEFEALKQDPNKVDDLLNHLGWNYDRLTQAKLQDGAVPPGVLIQQLKDEISNLKSSMKQEKDQEAEDRKKDALAAEGKAVTNFKDEIGNHLKNNSDRYELIDFEGAHELVFDIIDEHYNRTIDEQTGVGNVMSIAEAADRVEKHLEAKYLAAKEKNKVKAFWSNVPKGLEEQLKKQEGIKSQSQPPKTLTNNFGPKVTQRTERPPEEKRIESIVAEHVAKMRSQYAG